MTFLLCLFATISIIITWKLTQESGVTMWVAGIWTAAVGGKKIRDGLQANKGVYYNEDEGKLKKHE